MTVLVTGASGSVGSELTSWLRTTDVWATDIETLDVTDPDACMSMMWKARPSLVYHLAGAKHAPDGELDPAQVARVNIDGTLNILRAAAEVGAKVVVTSTCKACDPETAYGATKLIAERATLNADGTVVRFHNIPESSGNVFRLWESLPVDVPIPVTDCWRYFTPMRKAIDLLSRAAKLPSGRYAVDPGDPKWMPTVARELYPGRDLVMVARRRGDRHREPYAAACETVTQVGDVLTIVGAHDPAPVAQAA